MPTATHNCCDNDLHVIIMPGKYLPPSWLYSTLFSALHISYQLLNSLWILLGTPKNQLPFPASDLIWETYFTKHCHLISHQHCHVLLYCRLTPRHGRIRQFINGHQCQKKTRTYMSLDCWPRILSITTLHQSTQGKGWFLRPPLIRIIFIIIALIELLICTG